MAGCTVGPLTRFSAETAPGGDEPGLLRIATLNLSNRLYGGGSLEARRAADLLAGHPAAVWMLEEVIPFQYLPETVAPLYTAL